jgi:hypothetical protein
MNQNLNLLGIGFVENLYNKVQKVDLSSKNVSENTVQVMDTYIPEDFYRVEIITY